MGKWGGLTDETEKRDAPCHGRCGTIKIPPRSNAVRRWLKVCIDSPTTRSSPTLLHKIEKKEKILDIGLIDVV